MKDLTKLNDKKVLQCERALGPVDQEVFTKKFRQEADISKKIPLSTVTTCNKRD